MYKPGGGMRSHASFNNADHVDWQESEWIKTSMLLVSQCLYKATQAN